MNSDDTPISKTKKNRKGKGVIRRQQERFRQHGNQRLQDQLDSVRDAYFEGKLTDEEFKESKKQILNGTYQPPIYYEVTICAKSDNVSIIRNDLANEELTHSVLLTYGPTADPKTTDTVTVVEIDVDPYVNEEHDISDGSLHLHNNVDLLSEEIANMTIGDLRSQMTEDYQFRSDEDEIWSDCKYNEEEDVVCAVDNAITHIPRAYELALIKQIPLFEENFRGTSVPIPLVVWNALVALSLTFGKTIPDLGNGKFDELRYPPRFTFIPEKHIEWPLLSVHVSSPFSIRRYRKAWILFDAIGDIAFNGNVCLHGLCEYIAKSVVIGECTHKYCISIVNTQEDFENALDLNLWWHLVCVRCPTMKIHCNTITV